MRVLLISITILLSFTFAQAQGIEQLTIKHGQEKISKTGRISIKFVELVEDSRCPTDVDCIWAGVARIKVRLSRNGKTADFELNTNQGDKPAVFQGFKIGLKSLVPRQSTTSKYSPSAYTATVTVSKAGR